MSSTIRSVLVALFVSLELIREVAGRKRTQASQYANAFLELSSGDSARMHKKKAGEALLKNGETGPVKCEEIQKTLTERGEGLADAAYCNGADKVQEKLADHNVPSLKETTVDAELKENVETVKKNCCKPEEPAPAPAEEAADTKPAPADGSSSSCC
ncbi:unnamed protein product [Amoebophrya sp. A25]|nr:unnamed protein product [Amoebophrya sp. A25]|eukprot:GSA25T00003733001.1